MEEKRLLAVLAANLQQMPNAAQPAETVANLVMANNRLVATAAAAIMTLETVPQPLRPLVLGSKK